MDALKFLANLAGTTVDAFRECHTPEDYSMRFMLEEEREKVPGNTRGNYATLISLDGRY